MSNLTTVSLGILSAFVFLFFYWRRLQEDWEHDTIFKSGLFIVLLFILGASFTSFLIPRIFPQSVIFTHQGLWFWGALIGVIVGLFITVRINKFPPYEAFEAVVVGFMFASIFMTRELVPSGLALFSYYYAKRKYKSFHWYKSGKVGFSGLAACGVFFLARALIALFPMPMLVYTGIGRVEVVVSAALAFLSFFGIYNLSEQK